MDSPSNSMSPDVGSSMPVSWLKNVVLPAPFGPMIDTIAPRGIVEVDVAVRHQAAEAHW